MLMIIMYVPKVKALYKRINLYIRITEPILVEVIICKLRKHMQPN